MSVAETVMCCMRLHVLVTCNGNLRGTLTALLEEGTAACSIIRLGRVARLCAGFCWADLGWGRAALSWTGWAAQRRLRAGLWAEPSAGLKARLQAEPETGLRTRLKLGGAGLRAGLWTGLKVELAARLRNRTQEQYGNEIN